MLLAYGYLKKWVYTIHKSLRCTLATDYTASPATRWYLSHVGGATKLGHILASRGWYKKITSVFVNQLTREFSYNIVSHYNYLSLPYFFLSCLISQSPLAMSQGVRWVIRLTWEDKNLTSIHPVTILCDNLSKAAVLVQITITLLYG